MNYFKRGVIITIILSIFIMPIYGSYVGKAIDSTTGTNIVKMVSYRDNRVKTYTIIELNTKIEEQREIINKANIIINNAKSLGWPDDCETIYIASTQKFNANLILNFYTKELNSRNSKEYPTASYIWNYMKDLGWSDTVCAGILGNMMTECGGHTLNLKYQAKTKSYYGICQWGRHYSAVWNTNLETQCNFLRDTIEYEINTFGGLYKKGFNYKQFLNLTNEKDVALAFAKCYERCAGGYSGRQNNAVKAYNYFVK